MPEILAGHDVLLAAPTASGKTETFAAPAAEVVLSLGARERGRLTALFVSPTRALANDLKRRLEAPYHDLGVSFGRHTGEHKERSGGGFPEVCVTTPEAFDALLSRRPESILHLRLVVLDEIHVLDGTPRGDQLRVLCWRLDRAVRQPAGDGVERGDAHRDGVQRVLSSATIEDPHGTASRYQRDPRVVAIAGSRPIRAKSFAGTSAAAVAQHLATLAAHGFRKILVFCGRRRDVETFVVKLRDRCVFSSAVFAHHGSLAQRERERSERRFLEAPAAVLFATMTLEMGIDIGSVDYVLLVEPPPDVASLIQRIGRGSRRGDHVRVGCVSASLGEEHRFGVLLRAAAKGEFLGAPYTLRPSVLVQQALAIAGARGFVDAESLRENVPPEIWDAIAPSEPRGILTAMTEAGLFEPPRAGRHVLSENAEQRWDSGVLHSNIDDAVTLDVVDRITGDVIGSLDPNVDQEPVGKLGFAGGGRDLVGNFEGRLLTDRTDPVEAARFRPRGSPCCSFAQGRAVVEALGLQAGEVRQVVEAGSAWVLHGLGTAGALWFAKHLEAAHSKTFVRARSPYVLSIEAPLDELLRPTVSDGANFVRKYEKKLAKLLGMGPHHRSLPEELRIASVGHAAGLGALREFLCAAEFVTQRHVSSEWLDTAMSL